MKCHLDQLRTQKDTSEVISTPVTTSTDSIDIDIDTSPYSPSEDTTVSQTTTEQTIIQPATTDPAERH